LIWVTILASWEAAYRTAGWKPWIFPAPSHVIDAALAMLNIGSSFGDPVGPGWPHLSRIVSPQHAGWKPSPLVMAVSVSIVRLIIGFLVSIAMGVVLGILMWRWTEMDRLLGPLFLGLQTLPSVCWVPLGIICFGLRERGILFVLVMGSFSAVAIALRDGLRNIPPLYPRAGMMLGAHGLKLYRYVLLPASLPALAGSLRQGFSFAWRSLIGAELIFIVDRWHGLGYLLQTARDFSDVAQVVAVMIVMVVIGMLVDRWVFAPLQRRIQVRFGLA
jgi:NitT/TauT family transport system permease protein